MDKQTLWAIAGKYGFYLGTWHTRREAIKAHVQSYFGNEKDLSKHWTQCKRKGDRAVKVRLTLV